MPKGRYIDLVFAREDTITMKQRFNAILILLCIHYTNAASYSETWSEHWTGFTTLNLTKVTNGYSATATITYVNRHSEEMQILTTAAERNTFYESLLGSVKGSDGQLSPSFKQVVVGPGEHQMQNCF